MKTALITGASSGIGKAFARELAISKTNLILVARSRDRLEELAAQLKEEYSIEVEVISCDLTAPQATKSVFETVAEKDLQVDLLINNAGFGDYGEFARRDLSKQVQMIQLNTIALVELTYLFLPGMKERANGGIINVSSIAGFQPLPYMSVYSATKAFVLHFTEALWAENSNSGINILALCPGATESNFAVEAEFPKQAFDSNVKLATAEEVAKDALSALANNKCTLVTGSITNQIIVNLPRFLPREFLVSSIEKQFKLD
ncbi:MAG: SDR family oxidoreductase [Prochloraceae cyanobacterium]|nr:SDR family oxidoreductase [Prochloraceae cyanobacterium]